METVNFQQAKETFISLYGNDVYNEAFDSFNDAFLSAWDGFDFISGAESIEDFAEGMCECWQLSESVEG